MTNIPKTVFFFPLCFFLFSIYSIQAQYYDAGQEPFSVKWNQIITKNFRIIYPCGFDTNAVYVSHLMEESAVLNSFTLKAKVPRMPVILHNRVAVSNGFVIWAPRRTEFYTTPPQDSYAGEWLGQLAIHEYRHIVQFSKLNKGFTRVIGWILGEQAYDIVTAVFIPMWFMEGDAVCSETAHSKSGRGRLPVFEMKLRTQVLGKKIYSYDKAVFGSYRDYIPDRYILGYHLVAGSREKYGYQLWDKTLDYVARYPFMIMPFSMGIRKSAGKGKEGLYREVLKDLKSGWITQSGQQSFTSGYIYPVKNRPSYTNYTKPYYVNDSVVICQKSGMDDIERFILISRASGKEEKVFTPGMKTDDNLSYSNRLLVWAEIQPDKRWENNSYSDIRLFDLLTGQYDEITHKAKYFAPALSLRRDRIAAVEVTTGLKYNLILLDVATKNTIARIPTPANCFIMTPAWSDEDSMVVFIALCDSGKCLMAMNTYDYSFKKLTSGSFTEISKPVVSGNFIFFTGAWSGIDNIYALDLVQNKIFRITSSRYGCDFPGVSPDGSKLIFSEYTPDGYRIAEISIKDTLWEPLQQVSDQSIKLHQHISGEEAMNPAHSPDTSVFVLKKYSKGQHLFRFHSWGPVSINVDNTSVNPGLTVVSQDLLSTCFITGGYEYNVNERTGKYFTKITYKGFYPVIDFYADYGKRADSYTASDNSKKRYTWDELNLRANISQPLNLTRSKYYQGLLPSFQFTAFNIIHDKNTPLNYVKGWFYSFDYRLFFYHYIKQSVRQLMPRFGQILQVNFRHSPFGSNDIGNIRSLELTTYFPGILKSHGIRVYSAIQQKNRDVYRYSDLILYPRGYKEISYDKAFSVRTEYRLPLLYPDLSIPCFIYLKRITLAGFFDYSCGAKDGNKLIYRSAGAELLAELHVFRFIAPLNLGIRTTYMMETGNFRYEFLFSFDFSSY